MYKYALIGLPFIAPVLAFITGSNTSRDLFFFLLLLLWLFNLIYGKSKINGKIQFYITFSALFLTLLSIPIWETGINHFSYTGIVYAFVVYQFFDLEVVKKVITYIVVFSFILALYEYLMGSFIFSNTIIRNGVNITIDEKLVGGSSGVFRSKSIFYGPLDFGNFLIMASFFLSKNRNLIIIILLSAFLANTRLALLVVFTVLILNHASIKNFLYLIILMPVLILYLFKSSENIILSIERIYDIFNVANTQNLGRLYYWNSAVDFFQSQDIFQLLLGSNGKFNQIYGNSTESAWLSLLVDNGILGLLFYLTIFFIVYKKNQIGRINIFLLILCFSIQTFHLGMSTNLLLWLYFFFSLEYNTYLFPNSTNNGLSNNLVVK